MVLETALESCSTQLCWESTEEQRVHRKSQQSPSSEPCSHGACGGSETGAQGLPVVRSPGKGTAGTGWGEGHSDRKLAEDSAGPNGAFLEASTHGLPRGQREERTPAFVVETQVRKAPVSSKF